MSNRRNIVNDEDINLGCGNHVAPEGHPQFDICFPERRVPSPVVRNPGLGRVACDDLQQPGCILANPDRQVAREGGGTERTCGVELPGMHPQQTHANPTASIGHRRMSQASAQTWPEQGEISIDNSSVIARCVPDSLGDILYVDLESVCRRNSDQEQLKKLWLLLLFLNRVSVSPAWTADKCNS